MNDIFCNFCQNKFKNASALKVHQTYTKYCLVIQGKIKSKENEKKEFRCELCDKVLTSKRNLENHVKKCKINECSYCNKTVSNLLVHENECIEKKNEEIRVLIKDRNIEYQEKEKLKIQIKYYEKQIKKQEDEIKELHQTIERLSIRAIDKPTTTNNTNLNITTSIDFNDINKIKDIIEDNFNINYAVNGQKGIARFVTDKLLTDDNGKLIYICTDPSRQIFKYKDSSTGEIKKDVEAKKLTNYIIDAGIKQKTVVVANDWYKDDEGKIDLEKFNIMLYQQQSILNIEDDNSCFKKELASITTY
jgi:hypothetical protein